MMYNDFSRTINYSSVNEDWRTEAEALRLGAEDRLLCVTGSGDRPLNLLCSAPARVYAIDRNPAQNELLRLKMAALQRLDFADYAAFLGLHAADAGWRRGVWRQLASSLPAPSRAFWQRRGGLIGRGVLYQGRFERHFRRLALLGRLIRPRAVDALFAFDDLEEQRRFVREQWDTALWRLAYRVLCSPLYSRLFYGDPAYYAHVAVPVGLYLFERMRNALLRCLARENFMMGLVLRGSLPPGDLPPYLTPAGYETIRSRLDRLRVVDADLVSYLREEAAQPFSRFSLSDVPSFLDRAGFESLFDHVLRRAAPEARVVVRQFLTRHCPSGPLAARIRREPKLEARLALEDRAFAYEFIVGEVLDGAAA